MGKETTQVNKEELNTLVGLLGEVIGHVIFLKPDEGLKYLTTAARVVSNLNAGDN